MVYRTPTAHLTCTRFYFNSLSNFSSQCEFHLSGYTTSHPNLFRQNFWSVWRDQSSFVEFLNHHFCVNVIHLICYVPKSPQFFSLQFCTQHTSAETHCWRLRVTSCHWTQVAPLYTQLPSSGAASSPSPPSFQLTSDLKSHLGSAHIALFRQVPRSPSNVCKTPEKRHCAEVSTGPRCLS